MIRLLGAEQEALRPSGEKLPLSSATVLLLASVHSGRTKPDEIISFMFGHPSELDDYREAYQDALDAAVNQDLVEARDGGVWLKGDWDADWAQALGHVRHRETRQLRALLADEFGDRSAAQISSALRERLGSVGLAEEDRTDLLLLADLISL